MEVRYSNLEDIFLYMVSSEMSTMLCIQWIQTWTEDNNTHAESGEMGFFYGGREMHGEGERFKKTQDVLAPQNECIAPGLKTCPDKIEF